MWHDFMDDSLSREAFFEKVVEMLERADYDWIIHARQAEGIRPVGIVLAQQMLDGRRIEPHVDWFPWATPRNKLEGSAAFLREISKRFKIVLYVDENERGFWERLKQYGLIRHGCKVWDHFELGEHAYFFYTAGL